MPLAGISPMKEIESYLILMFEDLWCTIDRAVEALHVLRNGTLVDWAKALEKDTPSYLR
jgi:hypothetical protein